MANHARPVSLTKKQRRALERIARSHTGPAGLSRRARAVLLMADDVPNVEVARATGLGAIHISRIRRRYAEEGIDGLSDRPRSGRPKLITSTKIADVVSLTVSPPPKGITHWSSREVAMRTDVSPSTVLRIWREANLKPHRIETFKFTTDPKAKEKIIDVVGLYLNPPDNAIVLCLDEKTQIQALDRTQPILPLRPGLPARMTHDYRRHGVTSLFAALEVATGEVVGTCRPRHTSADFISFLDDLTYLYEGENLHIVLDNVSTHRTPAVQSWLQSHPNVQFHFTPTGASWMNMVEAWFSVLTRRSVRRATSRSVKALIRHIEQYIRHWNLDPKPFVWTKSAEEIIAKAVRT
jgi:transposase